MTVPIHRFTVVDSNARSRGGLAGALAAVAGGGPVPLIPDALVVEMMKVEGSARGWAQVLGVHPEAFRMARPPGAIVRDEIAGKEPISFVNHAGTAAVRKFVEDYAGRGEPALSEQMAGVEAGLTDARAAETMFNVDFIREVSPESVKEVVDSLPLEDVEALRAASRSGDTAEPALQTLRERLVRHPPTLGWVATHMTDGVADDATLERLARDPTVVRAGALLVVAEVVHAIEHNRLTQGLVDKTLVNDAVDGQGVLLSALCEGFLCADGRSLYLHRLVRAGMGLPPGPLAKTSSPDVSA